MRTSDESRICPSSCDLVDPTQNTTREISDVGYSRVGELVRRVHAADADLAVENCLPPLVESGNLVRNPVERNETRAWYVTELPFVRLPDIYDLELLSPVVPVPLSVNT